MKLFGIGQSDLEDRVAKVERELASLASALRQLEGEQLTLHDQVKRWWRRALAAERNISTSLERDQGPVAAPPPPPAMDRWGARGRITLRRWLKQQRTNGAAAPVPESEGTDGADS